MELNKSSKSSSSSKDVVSNVYSTPKGSPVLQIKLHRIDAHRERSSSPKTQTSNPLPAEFSNSTPSVSRESSVSPGRSRSSRTASPQQSPAIQHEGRMSLRSKAPFALASLIAKIETRISKPAADSQIGNEAVDRLEVTAANPELAIKSEMESDQDQEERSSGDESSTDSESEDENDDSVDPANETKEEIDDTENEGADKETETSNPEKENNSKACVDNVEVICTELFQPSDDTINTVAVTVIKTKEEGLDKMKNVGSDNEKEEQGIKSLGETNQDKETNSQDDDNPAEAIKQLIKASRAKKRLSSLESEKLAAGGTESRAPKNNIAATEPSKLSCLNNREENLPCEQNEKNPYAVFEKPGPKASAFTSDSLEKYLEKNKQLNRPLADCPSEDFEPDTDNIYDIQFISFASREALRKHQALQRAETVLAGQQELVLAANRTPEKTKDITKIKGWKKKFLDTDESGEKKSSSGSINVVTVPLPQTKLFHLLKPKELGTLGLSLREQRPKMKRSKRPKPSKRSIAQWDDCPKGHIYGRRYNGRFASKAAISYHKKKSPTFRVSSRRRSSGAKSDEGKHGSQKRASSRRRLPQPMVKPMVLTNTMALAAASALSITPNKCEKAGCRYGCICHLCSGSDIYSENAELQYDPQLPSPPLPKPMNHKLPQCGQAYCRLGCVCESLRGPSPATVPMTKHCGRPECMFSCNCERTTRSKTRSLLWSGQQDSDPERSGSPMTAGPENKEATSTEACEGGARRSSRIKQRKSWASMNKMNHLLLYDAPFMEGVYKKQQKNKKLERVLGLDAVGEDSQEVHPMSPKMSKNMEILTLVDRDGKKKRKVVHRLHQGYIERCSEDYWEGEMDDVADLLKDAPDTCARTMVYTPVGRRKEAMNESKVNEPAAEPSEKQPSAVKPPDISKFLHKPIPLSDSCKKLRVQMVLIEKKNPHIEDKKEDIYRLIEVLSNCDWTSVHSRVLGFVASAHQDKSKPNVTYIDGFKVEILAPPCWPVVMPDHLQKRLGIKSSIPSARIMVTKDMGADIQKLRELAEGRNKPSQSEVPKIVTGNVELSPKCPGISGFRGIKINLSSASSNPSESSATSAFSELNVPPRCQSPVPLPSVDNATDSEVGIQIRAKRKPSLGENQLTVKRFKLEETSSLLKDQKSGIWPDKAYASVSEATDPVGLQKQFNKTLPSPVINISGTNISVSRRQTSLLRPILPKPESVTSSGTTTTTTATAGSSIDTHVTLSNSTRASNLTPAQDQTQGLDYSGKAPLVSKEPGSGEQTRRLLSQGGSHLVIRSGEGVTQMVVRSSEGGHEVMMFDNCVNEAISLNELPLRDDVKAVKSGTRTTDENDGDEEDKDIVDIDIDVTKEKDDDQVEVLMRIKSEKEEGNEVIVDSEEELDVTDVHDIHLGHQTVTDAEKFRKRLGIPEVPHTSADAKMNRKKRKQLHEERDTDTMEFREEVLLVEDAHENRRRRHLDSEEEEEEVEKERKRTKTSRERRRRGDIAYRFHILKLLCFPELKNQKVPLEKGNEVVDKISKQAVLDSTFLIIKELERKYDQLLKAYTEQVQRRAKYIQRIHALKGSLDGVEGLTVNEVTGKKSMHTMPYGRVSDFLSEQKMKKEDNKQGGGGWMLPDQYEKVIHDIRMRKAKRLRGRHSDALYNILTDPTGQRRAAKVKLEVKGASESAEPVVPVAKDVQRSELSVFGKRTPLGSGAKMYVAPTHTHNKSQAKSKTNEDGDSELRRRLLSRSSLLKEKKEKKATADGEADDIGKDFGVKVVDPVSADQVSKIITVKSSETGETYSILVKQRTEDGNGDEDEEEESSSSSEEGEDHEANDADGSQKSTDSIKVAEEKETPQKRDEILSLKDEKRASSVPPEHDYATTPSFMSHLKKVDRAVSFMIWQDYLKKNAIEKLSAYSSKDLSIIRNMAAGELSRMYRNPKEIKEDSSKQVAAVNLRRKIRLVDQVLRERKYKQNWKEDIKEVHINPTVEVESKSEDNVQVTPITSLDIPVFNDHPTQVAVAKSEPTVKPSLFLAVKPPSIASKQPQVATEPSHMVTQPQIVVSESLASTSEHPEVITEPPNTCMELKLEDEASSVKTSTAEPGISGVPTAKENIFLAKVQPNKETKILQIPVPKSLLKSQNIVKVLTKDFLKGLSSRKAYVDQMGVPRGVLRIVSKDDLKKLRMGESSAGAPDVSPVLAQMQPNLPDATSASDLTAVAVQLNEDAMNCQGQSECETNHGTTDSSS